MDVFIEVLKWIGAAIAVGFVGYFGRYLAMTIIEKLQRKQPGQSAAKEQSEEISTSTEINHRKNSLKLEKKRTKAEAKSLKKAKDK